MISKSWRAFSFYTSISSKMFLQIRTKLLLQTVTLRLYIECTPVDYVVVYYRLTDWHSSIRWAAAHLLSYASHQVPYFCLCSCIQRFVQQYIYQKTLQCTIWLWHKKKLQHSATYDNCVFFILLKILLPLWPCTIKIIPWGIGNTELFV